MIIILNFKINTFEPCPKNLKNKINNENKSKKRN